jgi:uncharacterized heparinase superfamily protein
VQDIPNIVAYARKHTSKEVETILSEADGLIRGTFRLAGRDTHFSDRVPWRGHFPDREQTFCLNRWYHGVTLAKAYAYTGSEQPVQRFVELLEHWAAECSRSQTGPVWESYSVGERIVNWLLSEHLLQQSPLFCERGQPLLRRLLEVHAAYLSAHPETRTVHNHLINNARALFTYGVLCPRLKGSEGYRNWAWAVLTQELERQFDEDGMLREQSTHYHLLLTERYAEVALLAQRNGFDLPQALTARLNRMFATAALFVRPDRSLVTIGDVSPDVDPSQLTGVLALGFIFGAGSAISPSERTLWLLGQEGLDSWRADQLPTGARLLGQAGIGIHYTRTLHAMLRCDPKAEVVRHGHHDPLGLELWFAGRAVLLDPGNSTFEPDSWGRFFRGPFAHSTVVVDDMHPFVRSASLRRLFPTNYSSAEASIAVARNNDGFAVHGSHSGYQRLPDPVSLRRSVNIADDDTLVIRDSVVTSGRHSARILFQLADNAATITGPGRFEVFDPHGVRLAEFHIRSENTFSLGLHSGETEEMLLGWRSPTYGQRVRATVAVCTLKVDGPAEIETVITLMSPAESRSGR